MSEIEVEETIYTDSILKSIKNLLGIHDTHKSFDSDILTFTNMALNTLTQLGVGPSEGYTIKSESDVWTDFIQGDQMFEDVKSYVYLKVRLIFDPPSNSFLVKAIEDQLDELAWRIHVKGGARSW